MVNNKTTRVSIAVPNGPMVDTVVCPILQDNESTANYKSMKYMDYLDLLFGRKFNGQSCLDHVKII